MHRLRVDALTQSSRPRRDALKALIGGALGVPLMVLAEREAMAKKDRKDKRCKRDRRELKRLKSQEFCPQRGCCQCSATASQPPQCATFPVETFADDCLDLCTGSSASFGVSPTGAFANFCGTDALCVRIDCPVA